MTMKADSVKTTIPQPEEMKAARHKIRICLGSSCFSKAKQKNLEFIELFLNQHNLSENVDFAGHLCIEKCNSGPNIEIDGIMYHEVYPDKLEKILQKHLVLNESL